MKFCPKADANLFSMICELLHGNRIASDHCNNKVVNTSNGDIILDCQTKTHNSWVAKVEFLHEAKDDRAVSATALPKKNVNDLCIELGHPSETIICATATALSIQVVGSFKSCEECALGKAKQRLCLIRKFWRKGFSSI